MGQRLRFGVDQSNHHCRVDLIGMTPQDIASISDAATPYELKQE
ncbi:MAG: hypothetical protein Q7J64_04740 [Elusimicrobiota bacterium]|nr:hypothetical protein [Elusimicrobiota bacterium]